MANEQLSSNPLLSMLERARPCVRESLNHWDKMLLAQEKAPRSNAPHMLPDHYIGTLRDQVKGLMGLLAEIDSALAVAADETTACLNEHPSAPSVLDKAEPETDAERCGFKHWSTGERCTLPAEHKEACSPLRATVKPFEGRS